MKLAEAAHILGISLEDVTIDSLNKTYKKLVMTWDPEKVSHWNRYEYEIGGN